MQEEEEEEEERDEEEEEEGAVVSLKPNCVQPCERCACMIT